MTSSTGRQGDVQGGKERGIPIFLVAYDGSPMSEVQLHLACRSANDVGATVRVLYVVELSRHLPLTAPLSPTQQERVDATLDRAERILARYGVQGLIEVTRARSVGEAIVADAEESNARTIFIGLRDRNRPGTSLMLSGTLRHVLQNAPCPVQIGYLPAGLPEQFALEDDDAATT
jgi:nucleotide-binding universal stress UspA family protein